MTAFGYEIVKYFNSEWPEDWFVDDSVLEVAGEKILAVDASNKGSFPLDSRYELSDFGELCSYGEGRIPTLSGNFSKWKKAQTHTTMRISFEKEREDDVMEILKAAGVKVER